MAASVIHRTPKTPITTARILDTAFAIVRAEGFAALTMRRVALALDTGPASLYQHVRGKAELDDLMVAELSRGIRLPTPDASRWRDDFVDVCSQLRDAFLANPGISAAVFATAPTREETLTVSEGMLGILLAGRVAPRPAAWATDAALLYVAGYSLEASLRDAPPGESDAAVRARADARLAALPADRFPLTRRHALEINAGSGDERFEFTLRTLLAGLVAGDATTASERGDS